MVSLSANLAEALLAELRWPGVRTRVRVGDPDAELEAGPAARVSVGF